MRTLGYHGGIQAITFLLAIALKVVFMFASRPIRRSFAQGLGASHVTFRPVVSEMVIHSANDLLVFITRVLSVQ